MARADNAQAFERVFSRFGWGAPVSFVPDVQEPCP
jgi:hypothetical protein